MIRRRLLIDEKYIQDGLVFWLDGIKKGNNPLQWSSLIGNYTFDLIDCTFLNNSVQFNGSTSYGIMTQDSIIASATTGTIEVCYNILNPMDNTQSILFTGGIYSNRSQIGMAVYNIDRTCLSDFRNTGNRKRWNTSASKATTSLSLNKCISNGSIISTYTIFSSFAPNIDNSFTIGYRKYSSNEMRLNGNIYAIRMYNRILTDNEVLHNQKIDNRRFNLGLTI